RDYLSARIERAKRKAAERKLSAKFIVQDALSLETMPGPSAGAFDTVVDSGLFPTFSDEDRARYVAGLAHVLKPGGRLLLMCFSEAEPGPIGPRRVTQA